MRLAVAAIIIVAIYIVAAGSVSTTLSSGDLQAIGMLRGVETCRDRLTFDAEIRCLRVVQAAVLAIAPGRACAAKGVRIEPLDFVRRGYGCCFDRARFIEKALSHYGFSTRRVAMYERRRGWIGFLIPGIDSHAASEVRTRRGWLAVDSEQPFMLITRGGRPLQFDELHTVDPRTLYTRPTRSHSFGFENAYFVVRGLYSRHGQSHGVRLPAPEINYPDFLRYAVFGRD
ncbi:MAG TPA: hypothetical protein VF695_15300 [Sphingomonas sp.]